MTRKTALKNKVRYIAVALRRHGRRPHRLRRHRECPWQGPDQGPDRGRVDIAQANNDGYQWNIGNPGLHSGRYYARALPTPQCKAANSVTLQAQA
jgi:hypothetical protein